MLTELSHVNTPVTLFLAELHLPLDVGTEQVADFFVVDLQVRGEHQVFDALKV